MFALITGPETLIFLPLLALYVIPFWKIVGKAGFNPWLSLLTFIPLVNIIALFVFAFVKWPVESRSQPG